MEKFLKILKLNYFFKTLRHKYWVFIFGRKYLNVNVITLLLHDLSKFGFHEYLYYQKRFYGNQNDDCSDFDIAWLHHQNTNKHHWEYWILRTEHFKSDNTTNIREMPDLYVREMIADWMSASKCYNPENKEPDVESWDWFNNSIDSMKLHPNTKLKIYKLIYEIHLQQIKNSDPLK